MFDFLLKKDHLVMADFKWTKLLCHNTGKYCCTAHCTAWRTVRVLHDVKVGEGEVVKRVCEGYCVELWETH